MLAAPTPEPVVDKLVAYHTVHWERKLSRKRAAEISGWFTDPGTKLYLPDMHILFVSHLHEAVCEPDARVALCYRALAGGYNRTWIWDGDAVYRVITSWRAELHHDAERDAGIHLFRKYYERQFATGPRPTYWFALLEQEIYNVYSKLRGDCHDFSQPFAPFGPIAYT